MARQLRRQLLRQGARFLTHDRERIASFQSDKLITRAISVDILLALYEAADRVVADARAITIPTQLLISGADWVVHHGPQHRFYERLGTPIKERHVLPGFFHDTLGERDRALALAKAREFILARFAAPLHRPSLLDADRMGYTRDEADALASPLPALSARGLYWAAQRANIRIGGWLSAGIRLGHATGFDSGSTLDYVYRNQPQGFGALGRAIDRTYLESIGWTGIRQRKLHVEELLREAMARLHARGADVRVVDIAAGHGRYVLEALEGAAEKPDSILLRDYSDLNVAAGARLIGEKGLGDIARFVKGDAFDLTCSPPSSPGRRSAWCRASTNSSPTTRWCAARSPASATPSRPAAISSTPASPGTRSSSSSRAR